MDEKMICVRAHMCTHTCTDTHTHNYLDLKKNETLLHVTVWVNLKSMFVKKAIRKERLYNFTYMTNRRVKFLSQKAG